MGETGFACAYQYSAEGKYNALVMEMLGPSLECLFERCGRIFSAQTTLLLATQMLARLETLHRRTFIHRDQKPDNYCIGLGEERGIVYLIDFGLATRFVRGGHHVPYGERKAITGTVRYCSVGAHLGVVQSRRDDLEALCYILVYFARGCLPWQGLRATTKKQKFEAILERKLQTPTAVLCRGVPPELGTLLDYVRQLRFDDLPDYGYARGLFAAARARLRISDAAPFDWEIRGVGGPRASVSWGSPHSSRALFFGQVQVSVSSEDFCF